MIRKLIRWFVHTDETTAEALIRITRQRFRCGCSVPAGAAHTCPRDQRSIVTDHHGEALREDWARTQVARAGKSWTTHMMKFGGAVVQRQRPRRSTSHLDAQLGQLGVLPFTRLDP